MQTNVAAVTALAGSLFLVPLMLGPTQAGSAPDLKNAVNALHDSTITLVGHGGGGGRGGGGWGGGGGHMGSGHVGGGGGRSFAYHGGGDHMGGGGRAYAYHRGGDHMGGGARVYAGSSNRHLNGGKWDHGNNHGNKWARNDDNDHHHANHRHFQNGIWWGGPYLSYSYGYGNCYWLRQQAIITGSPYWWSRYESCLGYY